MDNEKLFKEYTLSRGTLDVLKSIRNELKEDILRANPIWAVIGGKREDVCSDSETDGESEDDSVTKDENVDDSRLDAVACARDSCSTQYFFTQSDQNTQKDITRASLRICDIVESLYECLERNNGKLDFAHLENLSDKELEEVVTGLKQKLSTKGIYNLCCSIGDINDEQRIRYINVICSGLLLPKLIILEESSRLMSSAICECIQKFPDDIQKFIFIPILNTDLKDTAIVNNMINAFDVRRRPSLIVEFVTCVKELKEWHISFLLTLLSVKTDCDTNDKLINLFLEKALCFSKDKNFGKLILSFLKINMTFSEEQQNSLWEIAIMNETLFKRPIENVLKNIQ